MTRKTKQNKHTYTYYLTNMQMERMIVLFNGIRQTDEPAISREVLEREVKGSTVLHIHSLLIVKIVLL